MHGPPAARKAVGLELLRQSELPAPPPLPLRPTGSAGPARAPRPAGVGSQPLSRVLLEHTRAGTPPPGSRLLR